MWLEVEADATQPAYCLKGHRIDLSWLAGFEPLGADSTDEDSSGSEGVLGISEMATMAIKVPSISLSTTRRRLLVGKAEFDKSGRRLALELDAVSGEVERLERKEGNVVGKPSAFGVWGHEHSPGLSHADAEVRRS